MSSQELASAVTIGRVTGSTVVEVSVKLAARSEAAAVAQNAIELVVQHLAEIVGEGAEVSIIADNYPSEEGNGSADLWLRRAGIGAVLGAGLAALALAIAQSTRGIVLGDQTAEAIARAPILARVKRRRSNADDREFDPRVFTEKLAILTGNPVRFLVLVCASPAEASLATRSAALKRVAEAMGADTMTLGSHGRSGHEMLSRWEELARIGPYQASIVVSAELQSRSAGADTLADLARWRPVILVTEVTPLALACAVSADATVPVMFVGSTRIAGLQSSLADLRQVGVDFVGSMALDA